MKKSVSNYDVACFSLCNWPKRHRNEDRLFLRQSGGVLLACVFDGVTTSNGYRAAKLGARAFRRAAGERLTALNRGEAEPQDLLRDCIDAANRELLRQPHWQDLGSTVSAVLAREGQVFSAWLGDSPILHYAAEEAELTPLFFPDKNIRGEITRFLGDPNLQKEDVPVLLSDFRAEDTVLLGSDGALETLSYSDCKWSKAEQDEFVDHYERYLTLLRPNRSAKEFAETLRLEIQKQVACDDASLIAIRPAAVEEGR